MTKLGQAPTTQKKLLLLPIPFLVHFFLYSFSCFTALILNFFRHFAIFLHLVYLLLRSGFLRRLGFLLLRSCYWYYYYYPLHGRRRMGVCCRFVHPRVVRTQCGPVGYVFTLTLSSFPYTRAEPHSHTTIGTAPTTTTTTPRIAVH